MKITTMILGIVSTNTYIITTEKNNAIIVDPADNTAKILKHLEDNNLNLSYILLTHAHFDHIGAVNGLVEKTQAKLFIHEAEEEIIKDPMIGISDKFSFVKASPCFPDVYLKDNETFDLDELTIKVIYTPGHTNGCCCYVINDCIFSGDTLFCESIGRTDLYSSDYNKIIVSVKKLAALEGDYNIYPGHGDATTMSHEREYNSYIGTKSYDDYF